MPKTPRNLQTRVLEVINVMAGPRAKEPISTIGEKDKLENAFGLTGYQRKALGAPFVAIADDWNPDAEITRTSCEKLKTTGDAVKLVSKEAGFDGSWLQ